MVAKEMVADVHSEMTKDIRTKGYVNVRKDVMRGLQNVKNE